MIYKKVADLLKCEEAAIAAVVEVESRGSSLMPDGRIKILFEPHIFYRICVKKGIKINISDIAYPVWGMEPYGNAVHQYDKLERAKQIYEEAALMSCSWGMFQIMGFNFGHCKCSDVFDFVERIKAGPESEIDLFSKLIIAMKIDDELRQKNWAGFAKSYNGPGYKKNQYDIKLQKAYNKWKKKIG